MIFRTENISKDYINQNTDRKQEADVFKVLGEEDDNELRVES